MNAAHWACFQREGAPRSGRRNKEEEPADTRDPQGREGEIDLLNMPRVRT